MIAAGPPPGMKSALEGQLERLRAVLSAILELAEELQQGAIERVLAKSDLELGIEALLRMTKGRWCASPPFWFDQSPK